MPIRPELRHLYRTPEWKAAREFVKLRAGDRCEKCDLANGTIATKQLVGISGFVWVEIQCGCAHLNGVAGDDRHDNLAWLCRGCHLRHDHEQHRQSRSIRKDAARPILAALTTIADKASAELAGEGRQHTPQLVSLKQYLRKHTEEPTT